MKSLCNIVCFALMFYCFPRTIFAVNYYIDNTCSVNGNGLGQSCTTVLGQNGPFNSLANAAGQITGNQSDNFLLLKKGQTYSGKFNITAYGTAGHPFTVSNFGSSTALPVVSGGTSNIEVGCVNCAYITIDGIKGIGATGSIDNGAGIWIRYPAHHITVRNSDFSGVTGSWSSGIQIDDSDDNTIAANSVHDNPHYGIMLLRRNTDYGITGNTIADNRVYNIGINGITSNSYSAGAKRIGRSYIYNNDVSKCTAGIYLHWTNDSYIYRNRVHNNGSAGGYGEDYGFGIRGSSNNEFYENEIYDNYDYAWNVYGDQSPGESTDNNKFYRNYISGTTAGHWGIGGGGRGFGIGAPQYDFTGNNNSFFNNILWNNDTNMVISDQGGTGNVAYGNVFYGGSVGLLNERNGAGWTATNNIFAENSLYLLDANNVTTWDSHQSNLYYRQNGGSIIRKNGTVFTISSVKTGFEPSALTGNPHFISSSPTYWYDFRLTNLSPAIDAGHNAGTAYSVAFDPQDIKWPPTAIDQNSYGSGWEIGPFVYTGNSSSPTSAPGTVSGDTDNDGDVDIYDYNILIANFGRTGSPGFTPADINRDGSVDIFDYNILVGNFGR